jgi:hypothetical protein
VTGSTPVNALPKLRWAGHIASMEAKRIAYKFLKKNDMLKIGW